MVHPDRMHHGFNAGRRLRLRYPAAERRRSSHMMNHPGPLFEVKLWILTTPDMTLSTQFFEQKKALLRGSGEERLPLEPGNIDPEAADTLHGCFLILSLLFRYPESEVYQRLNQHLSNFSPFFLTYSVKSMPLVPLEELQAEYIKLFVNNQGFVPVVPYVSYYSDRERLLAGTSLGQTRSIMSANGFLLDASRGELEDHIAVLLEFCARILWNLSTVDPCADKDHQEQLKALFQISYLYLSPVASSISDLIREYAELELYSLAGDVFKNFLLDLDHQYAGLLQMIDDHNHIGEPVTAKQAVETAGEG